MDGLLIAEIQQNSNTTYRVYDWNRRGADGRARPLHVERALEVINFAQVEPVLHPPQLISDGDGIRRERLCQNEYFTTERLRLRPGALFTGQADGESLEIWGTLAGMVEVNDVRLAAVHFALLPAALGPFTVRALAPSTLLRTYVE
jgi:mannose-6-phosphate isomerase